MHLLIQQHCHIFMFTCWLGCVCVPLFCRFDAQFFAYWVT
jgi:hypothetical protein